MLRSLAPEPSAPWPRSCCPLLRRRVLKGAAGRARARGGLCRERSRCLAASGRIKPQFHLSGQSEGACEGMAGRWGTRSPRGECPPRARRAEIASSLLAGGRGRASPALSHSFLPPPPAPGTQVSDGALLSAVPWRGLRGTARSVRRRR